MKRMLSRIVVASGIVLGSSVVSAAFAADGAGLPKPDAAAGEQLYVNGDPSRGILACVTCHGEAGNSTLPANPNLAGQAHEYLYSQLTAFASQDGKPPTRAGADGNPSIMTSFASAMTPQDMQNIAYYLSLQPLDYAKAGTATNENTMDRGQHIWRGGLPERGVPACAGCHSPNGAGVPGQYPRLAGQFPSYISDQLKLFRSGYRANNSVMMTIADRMSDADIAAVADYAAGLR